MGLDMYLTKKHFIGAEYAHRKVKAEIEISVEGKPIHIDTSKLSEITERVGYWRKANAIHAWLVANVQGGTDDCNEYHVSFEQLKTLRELCADVLKNENYEALAPRAGFFFGSTDIDEYYLSDLKHTIEIIDSLDSNGEYYYQSSW